MPTFTSTDPTWRWRQMDRFQNSMQMIAGMMSQRRKQKQDLMMKDIDFRLAAIDKDKRLASTGFADVLRSEKYAKAVPGLGDILDNYADEGASLRRGQGHLAKVDQDVVEGADSYLRTREKLEAMAPRVPNLDFHKPIINPQTGQEEMGPRQPDFPNVAREEGLATNELRNNPAARRAMAERKLDPGPYRDMRKYQRFAQLQESPPRGIDWKSMTSNEKLQWITANDPQAGFDEIAQAADVRSGQVPSENELRKEDVKEENWWAHWDAGLEKEKAKQEQDQAEWDRRTGVLQAGREKMAGIAQTSALERIHFANELKAGKPLSQQRAGLWKETVLSATENLKRTAEQALLAEGTPVTEKGLEGKMLELQSEAQIPSLQAMPPNEVWAGLEETVDGLYADPAKAAELQQMGYARPKDLELHYLKIYSTLVAVKKMPPAQALEFIRSGRDLEEALAQQP